MVRVRKLARLMVPGESVFRSLFAPLREASQLDSQLNESFAGAVVSRKLMPTVYLLLLLPLLCLLFPALMLVAATHARATEQFGEPAAWVLEGLLVVGVCARLIFKAWTASREVEPRSEELTLSPAEVEARLASGQLRPWDLVHDGQVWNTLEASPQFEFACEEPVARERRRRRLALAGKLFGWAAVLAAYAWWMTS